MNNLQATPTFQIHAWLRDGQSSVTKQLNQLDKQERYAVRLELTRIETMLDKLPQSKTWSSSKQQF